MSQKLGKTRFFSILKATEEKIESGSRTVFQCYGSADPDPCQNVPDPQHWLEVTSLLTGPTAQMTAWDPFVRMGTSNLDKEQVQSYE